MAYEEPDLPVAGTPVSVANFGVKVRNSLIYLKSLGGGANPLELPIIASQPPLSGLTAAAVEVSQWGSATIKPQFYKILFDGAADEGRIWQFNVPSSYVSLPKLVIQFHIPTADTAARTVIFKAQLACLTTADTLMSAKEYDTANAGSTAINGAAFYNEQQTITLTNNSAMLANDFCSLVLWRDADVDTCVKDAIVTYVGLSMNV